MKILIFMSGFLPGKKYGGPPVSINNFCNLMSEEDIYIVCTDHDLGEKKRYKDIKKGWNKRENCNVLYLNDNEYSISSFKKVINKINPDIIYLQSMFSKATLMGLIAAKYFYKKILLAPRGELDKGAFKKKYKKVPYIKVLKALGLIDKVYIQSTSPIETDSVIKRLGIDKNRIFEVDNIPDFPKEKLRHNKKEVGKLNLIFVSRIVAKKNIKFALECLKHVDGEVKYDIYGPIEDTNYWNECKNIIKKLPENIEVSYKGFIDREDIFNVMSKYDGLLFPTFSENYGQVIAEALLSGCVPIISDQTPWTDINDYKAGYAINLDDKSKYIDVINYLINSDFKNLENFRKNIKEYSNNKINIGNLKLKYQNILEAVSKNES